MVRSDETILRTHWNFDWLPNASLCYMYNNTKESMCFCLSQIIIVIIICYCIRGHFRPLMKNAYSPTYWSKNPIKIEIWFIYWFLIALLFISFFFLFCTRKRNNTIEHWTLDTKDNSNSFHVVQWKFWNARIGIFVSMNKLISRCNEWKIWNALNVFGKQMFERYM